MPPPPSPPEGQTLTAAEALRYPADALGGLVSKSLATSDISGSVTRYRLPETTRAYACAKSQANVQIGVLAEASVMSLRSHQHA